MMNNNEEINKLRKYCDIPMLDDYLNRGTVFMHAVGIVISKYATIGNNCKIWQNVTIGAKSFERREYPVIGNNVQIYAGACIFGNIKIGDNVIIGANSVVNKNIPSNSIVVGNPAKIIKKRKSKNIRAYINKTPYTEDEINTIEENANALWNSNSLKKYHDEQLENKKVFSILLPTYNREHLIKRAIDSVLNQTFPYFELIIIDDASTDNTEQLVKSINDDRILYIKHEKNKGQNAAYNTGIKSAQKRESKYIAFIDSDDEWLPTMLEETYKKFQSDLELGYVYVLAGVIKDNASKIKLRDSAYLEGYIEKEVLTQSYLTSPTFMVVKKSCFDKIGYLREELVTSKDDDMNFLFVRYYKVGLVPKILGVYYFNSNNRLGDNLEKVAEGWWILYKNHYKRFIKVVGKQVLAEHYEQRCLPRFLVLKNKKGILKCNWAIFKLSPTFKNFKKLIKSIGV